MNFLTFKRYSCTFILFVFIIFIYLFVTSLVAETVKRLPIMWETWVRSLGWEETLEKEMATHSTSTLAWKIPWMGEPGRHKESDTTE